MNAGGVKTIEWAGASYRTAIFKAPAGGRVQVFALGLEGDTQVDRRFHGGPAKAVYAYPSEHYAFWRERLASDDLGWGAFGENLTTGGVDEESVRAGDRFRAGSCVLEITKPRQPCVKLAGKFDRADIIDLFTGSGRCGFYLSVAREGAVAAGDAFERIARGPEGPSIAEVFRRKRR